MKIDSNHKQLRKSFNLTILIIIILGVKTYGQRIPVARKHINKDVMLAKEIHDSVVEPFTFPALGVTANFWYKFTTVKDTTFIFDIVPYEKDQDYGFELYKCQDENCAVDIKNRKLKWVRSCASENHGKYSSAGISLAGSLANIKKAPGFPYAITLPIKAGDTYYLKVKYINCCKDTCTQCNKFQKGFKLYLYNLWPNKSKKRMSKSTLIANEFILENVLFETNKSILLKESYKPLNILVNQLVSQKTMTIEIKGHTDNVGDEIKNQQLSEKRAKAVFDYLISKKISATRLSFRGLGDKEPIENNETEEGRNKNRRVSFVIITK